MKHRSHQLPALGAPDEVSLVLRAIRCGRGCSACPHGGQVYARWQETVDGRRVRRERYIGRLDGVARIEDAERYDLERIIRERVARAAGEERRRPAAEATLEGTCARLALLEEVCAAQREAIQALSEQVGALRSALSAAHAAEVVSQYGGQRTARRSGAGAVPDGPSERESTGVDVAGEKRHNSAQMLEESPGPGFLDAVLPRDDDALVTEAQAGAFFALRPEGMRHQRREGNVPFVKVGGLIRYRVGDLRALARSGRLPRRKQRRDF